MSDNNFVSYINMGHMGRLGNQIFQYAALISLADRLKCVPLINYNKVNFAPPDPLHKLVIHECFDLSITPEKNHIDTLYINHTCQFHNWNEPCHQYSSQFEQVGPMTNIHGYLQDEKYFRDKSELVRNELKFKEEFETNANNILKERPNTELVSLHIRRTDYLKYSNIHPQPGMDYFKACMKQFSPDTTFVVFSDDVNWCKEQFSGDNIWFQENDHFTDLCLMSKCDHHIIANSSFSWWGAWLCTNTDKKVFYPSVWFGKQSHLQHRNGPGEYSMCPPEWICMEVEDKTVPSTPYQPDPIIGL